jgi:hypothetical protein
MEGMMNTKITTCRADAWGAKIKPFETGEPDQILVEDGDSYLHVDCVSPNPELDPGEFYTRLTPAAARSLHEWLGAWLERIEAGR